MSLESEIERFNSELRSLDAELKKRELDPDFSIRLVQRPLADILTHIGQVSLMSRLNGHPIDGESFATTPIEAGTLSYSFVET